MPAEYIYVLSLENNKYYIGKAINVYNRYVKHITGKGAKWTCLYKPIDIICVIKQKYMTDETNFTKLYMKKYGIDNVRGGAYCQVEFEPYQIKILNSEINDLNCDTLFENVYRAQSLESDIFDCNRAKEEKSGQIWTRKDITAVKEMFNDGLSIDIIAQNMGRSVYS